MCPFVRRRAAFALCTLGMALAGTNPCRAGDPPPAATDLGTLTPGVPVVVNVPVVLGTDRRYYTFTIGQTVRMQDLTFLDIQSAVPAGPQSEDSEIAIYDTQGNLVVCDDDDGEGTRTAISFGCGSGAQPQGPDQIVHNGRDGDLEPGLYYMRIAAFNINYTLEEINWGQSLVASADLSPSTITITLGAAAALPDPPGTADLGDLVLGAQVRSRNNALAAGQVRFFKIRVPEVSSEHGRHLDIDTINSALAPANDTTLAVYLPNGALATTNKDRPGDDNTILRDSDSGPGPLAQLSFGLNSPARSSSGDGSAFSGELGRLRPGVYYIAVGGPGNVPSEVSASGTNFGFTSASGNAGAIDFNINAGDGDCQVGWQGFLFAQAGALNNAVRAIAQWDDDNDPRTEQTSVIAGSFTKVGDVQVARVARFFESDWEQLGNGLNGTVNTIVSGEPSGSGLGQALFAGGAFTKTGTTKINRVARFDGAAWVPVGEGFNGAVNALCFHDFDGNGPGGIELVAAGAFTKSGNAKINRIARFDVSAGAWVPIGEGLSGTVNALTSVDLAGDGNTILVVGGSFSKSGANTVKRCARLSGNTFVQLGDFNNAVLTLTAYDDDGDGPNPRRIYAGGKFTKSGTTTLNRVCRIEGDTPVALGSGFNNAVNALEPYDPDGLGPTPKRLIAGGAFTKTGQTPLARVAAWNGTDWSLIDGFGASAAVRTVRVMSPPASIVHTPQVWFGGDFKVLGNIARRSIGTLACPLVTGAPPQVLRVANAALPHPPTPCSVADLCGPGGPGTPPDGTITCDDALAFVKAWLEGDNAADLTSPDQVDWHGREADARLTVDDVIAFVESFAHGCD